MLSRNSALISGFRFAFDHLFVLVPLLSINNVHVLSAL